jgi:hypothetical protein
MSENPHMGHPDCAAAKEYGGSFAALRMTAKNEALLPVIHRNAAAELGLTR